MKSYVVLGRERAAMPAKEKYLSQNLWMILWPEQWTLRPSPGVEHEGERYSISLCLGCSEDFASWGIQDFGGSAPWKVLHHRSHARGGHQNPVRNGSSNQCLCRALCWAVDLDWVGDGAVMVSVVSNRITHDIKIKGIHRLSIWKCLAIQWASGSWIKKWSTEVNQDLIFFIRLFPWNQLHLIAASLCVCQRAALDS